MKRLSHLFLAVFMLPFGLACAADDTYLEGEQYNRVSPAQPTQDTDTIEVAEVFWYGCPHCYAFEPSVNAWKAKLPKNVKFVRIPATFGPVWKLHARAYYTAEVLGVVDKTHEPMFDAIHNRKLRINSEAQIGDFFESLGVDRKKFDSTFNSFAVDARMRKTTELIKGYKLRGVPALTINGKYTIGVQQAGSYKNMIKVAEFLLEKELKEQAK